MCVEVLSSRFLVASRCVLTENRELRTGAFLCGFQQRTQLGSGDAQRASGEAVNVGGIDAYDFTVLVQNRSAAASARRGRIVDQFVSSNVTDVAEGRRGPDQR